MADEQNGSADDIPRWSWYPVETCIDYLVRLRQTLLISEQGVRRILAHADDVCTAIADTRREVIGLDGSGPAQGEDVRRIAHEQMGENFRFIRGLIVVAMAAALENGVQEILMAWLDNQAGARQLPQVQQAEQRVQERTGAVTAEDLYDQLVAQNRRDQNNQSVPMGVDRFERLLGIFGLDGPFETGDRARLNELFQVRHTFAHRRGLADADFVSRCPGFGARQGDPIDLSDERMEAYFNVAYAYLYEITDRLRVAFGHPRILSPGPASSAWVAAGMPTPGHPEGWGSPDTGE